jgi:hypothetical protein
VEPEPRLLHRTRGYTTNPLAALPAEPEALQADDLDYVGAGTRDRELRAWQTARRRLLSEIEHVRVHVHSPHVRRATRALEREVAALDRKLTGL